MASVCISRMVSDAGHLCWLVGHLHGEMSMESFAYFKNWVVLTIFGVELQEFFLYSEF